MPVDHRPARAERPCAAVFPGTPTSHAEPQRCHIVAHLTATMSHRCGCGRRPGRRERGWRGLRHLRAAWGGPRSGGAWSGRCESGRCESGRCESGRCESAVQRRGVVRPGWSARGGQAQGSQVRDGSARLLLGGLLLGRGRVHDLDDPFQVIDGGELDDDLPLALPQFHLDPGLEQVGEAVGQVTEAGCGRRLDAGAYRAARRRIVGTDRDDLLDGADRQAFGDDRGWPGAPALRGLSRLSRARA